MITKRSLAALLLMFLPGAAGSGQPMTLTSLLHPTGSLERPEQPIISVLTYNVKGLPWPVARGRDAALEAIALRLRLLRAQARQPHIVVLQEAFTEKARSIGQTAGYPYIVDGPTASSPNPATPTVEDRRFMASARWWKGETQGKWVGSGLQVLSDYPVVGVRRIAYPAFACAGYDCLANKGALLVSVKIPGAPTPVDIITTHLNSKRSSGVPDERSLYAYRRQLGVLTAFIRDSRDPRRPLIVAGDFNVGAARPRRAALIRNVRSPWAPLGVKDALGEASRATPLAPDAAYALRRGRDWQFFSPGRAATLTLSGLDVPFGHERSGSMLSDHVGYTAVFRVDAKRSST